MKSMTGYGHASHVEDEYQLEVEIKSYNNRYLEVYTAINPALSRFEEEIVAAVRKRASRGKVEVGVRLKTFRCPSRVHVDEALLGQYLAAFRSIAEKEGLALRPDAGTLLGIDGLFTVSLEKDADDYRSDLMSCLEEALEGFAASRRREGEATKRDLERLGRSFQEANDEIGRLASGYEGYFRDLLLERYRELELGGRYDENRMLQEIAALLVKYSINEEQNRLKTHLKEYFRLIEGDGPAGKRLDFLAQEMNREVNTTASKSQNVEITLLTVRMKDDLENIREQIRNIE